MTPRQSFGAVLREIRTAHRLSQERLAGLAGIDHGFVSKIESGQRFPSPDTLSDLARSLRLTPEERQRLYDAHGTIEHPIDGSRYPELARIVDYLENPRGDAECKEVLRSTITNLSHLIGYFW